MSLKPVAISVSVHAFVMADYCNMLLDSAPRSVTDKLQRVLNVYSECDRALSQILHTDLHWLDVADRAGSFSQY